MKIKVCGMTRAQNLEDIALLGPSMIGLIFHPGSPRYVNGQLPKQALRDLPAEVGRVGVFVNPSLDEVLDKAAAYGLDFVQLHGEESPGFCGAVAGIVPVIKAFRIDAAFDFATVEAYAGTCDSFLFDAAGPRRGGNGLKFGWEKLGEYSGQTPFLLAGGISEVDAAAVAALEHPAFAGVDLNSGFERQPGLKDVGAVGRFMQALRGTPVMTFPDRDGYYGEFGGAYIPEMLQANVRALQKAFPEALADPEFQAEFHALLQGYAGRPTPLYEARRLSEAYGARIFLKREDLNHTGAHKLNNTIGQVLLAERMGKRRIIAETGAGQHGVATATVCALRGLECTVYMGAKDMARQAPNVARMRMLGAEVVPAVSGSQTLKDATNEAIRAWISDPDGTHYIIGSVVGPHPYPDMVARFQAVISAEIRKQLLAQTGRAHPDTLIACVGGGSNAAGAFFHYLQQPEVALVMAEAAGLGVDSGASAATSFLGKPGVLHASKTLFMQTADGQVVEPHSISAGLDYPGIGPMHAHLLATGRAHALAVTDAEALEAAFELARLEGIIPALESAHALACLPKMTFAPEEIVVVNLSGRGDKDMAAFIEHMEKIEKEVQHETA